MKKKNNFTMVEILLALGVCGIGICGIMVLFPIGANANRDAAMETYAANTADQMLHMLKYQVTTGTATSWTGKIGDSGSLPSANPANDGTNKDIKPDDAGWSSTAETEMNTIFAHSAAGIYQIISDRGSGSPSLTSDKVDFRAIMFVWWSDIDLLGAGHDDIGATLNVEVTWPAALPYPSRQKAHYALEVFNPN